MRLAAGKTCLACALGATVTCVSAGIAPWTVEVIEKGTTHRDLYSIVMNTDGNQGVAVGDRGMLLATEDGGTSWDIHSLDTTTDSGNAMLALFDVALAGERWLVVGQMGLVRYSDDRGQTWKTSESGTHERLLGVSSNEAGLAVAVGSFGTIRLSFDAGATWEGAGIMASEFVDEAHDPHLYDAHVTAEGTIFVIGEFGLILRSSDRGETWEAVHRGDVSLFALHMRSDGASYAVGQNGTVLRSRDVGESWQPLETGLNANLLGVHASADGTITIPGMRHMIVSDDGGETWHQVTAGDVDRNWYSAIAAGSAGVFAVGHSRRVIRITRD